MLKRVVRQFLFLLVLGICSALAGGYFFKQLLHKPLMNIDGTVAYQLKSGSSFSSLIYDLANKHYLQYPELFITYGRLTGLSKRVKAGEYHISPATTVYQLLEKIQRGEVVSHRVTFVEGLTVSQLLKSMTDKSNIRAVFDSQSEKWLAELNAQFNYRSLEGLIFPDTYQYVSGASDLSLLKQAFDRMQRVLAEEWKNKADNLPYQSPYEALIMASLIEKETGVASERRQIAGVFVRRLQKRMRLQTDPAVIYGLGDEFDGNLRSRHLKDATNPYNTYRHHGLPPTPIATAGREAIHAALHPLPGKSLYFVAKGDGSHYFSETLEEHNKAVRTYQVFKRRKDYRSAPLKQ